MKEMRRHLSGERVRRLHIASAAGALATDAVVDTAEVLVMLSPARGLVGIATIITMTDGISQPDAGVHATGSTR
jgi:hypothetical protein